MGLFEWMWERNQRSRSGHIESYEQKNTHRFSRKRVIFNFVLTLIVLALPFLWFEESIFDVPQKYLMVLALEAVYIFAGYHINPQPNSDNYGWAGGLIDNPFRISDDINRFLLFLRIILYPGRMFGVFIKEIAEMMREQDN